MKYAHHKYTWSKPWGTVRHSWEFIGGSGGVNFHVSGPYKDTHDEYSCGLEFHSSIRRPDCAPSHVDCWLTKAPCWHDGTSLYAQETLWPMIEPSLKSGDHAAIFRILEHDADRHFTVEVEP